MGYQLINSVRASELANLSGLALIGQDIEIRSVAALSDMQSSTLGFSRSALPRDLPGGCLIIGDAALATRDVSILATTTPRLDFMRILSLLSKTPGFQKRGEAAVIHESAQVSNTAVIGRGVVIGKNTKIGHFVVINDGVEVGENCVIKSGAVIGEDGFGFERDETGKAVRFFHLGSVRIGNDVEIGSLTTVCRGTLSDTVIEDGAKIDDHVHIAHNCRIGRHAFVIACAEVSGGVVLGEGVWVGPNASIIQQLKIGNGALVGIAANVLRDVEPGATMVGNPAKSIPSKSGK